MGEAVRPETDVGVLAPAVFNVCHGPRVGDAASIRRANVSQLGWISFYDRKTKRRWIPARLGVWAERWRQALLLCGMVQHRAQYVPLCSEGELECRMHFLLWGSPWAGVTWHCDSLRHPWSPLVLPSLLCASRTDGPRNDKPGSTPS